MIATAVTPMLVKKDSSQWKEVQICEEIVGISGGFLNKPLSAPSIVVMSGNKPQRFVEVVKNSEWFLKAVGGNGTQKGDLKTVNVMEDLRKRLELEITAVAVDNVQAAVADDVADDIGEVEADPMDALDDVVETPVKSKPKGNAKPKKKMSPSTIVQLKMPKRPTCAGGDQEDFTVFMYVKADNKHTSNSKAKLYLRTDCISWLLAYAADEKFFQGVARVEVKEPEEGNCAAVAGLNIEWNFTTNAWEAKFVSGEFAGTARELAITEVSEKLWEKMVLDALPGAEGDFQDVTELKKKQVCKALMTLWCQAIASKQGKEFEQCWGLALNQASKRRRTRKTSGK
jgi:hypothetical protein